MVDVAVLTGFLGLMASMGGAMVWLGGRDRLMQRRTKSVVVVTLKSGLAFRGVLFEADSRSLLLRNATALEQGTRGEHVPVDGEVFLARSEVEFLQRP